MEVRKALLGLTLLLLLGNGVAVSADFDKGREAYNSGDYETALAELNPLAQRGEARAQHLLGWLHLIHLDPATAIKWFSLAADQGYADAQEALGNIYENGEGVVPKNYQKAMKWFTLAADQGHRLALYSLWLMYQEGNVVHENDKVELRWNTKYAEQGFRGSQFYLGRMYEVGSGVVKNEKTAVSWYYKAASQGFDLALINLEQMAKQGNTAAQYKLGLVYFSKGNGNEYDKEIKWFTLAAEKGHVDAQYQLGRAYSMKSFKTGDLQHKKASAKWITKAAEQGHTRSQVQLGYLYTEEEKTEFDDIMNPGGYGIDEDNKTAFKWFKLAAEGGDLIAQYRLANMYAKGLGVLENDRKSFELYTAITRTGGGGGALAASALGTMYADGEGVRKDLVRAYMWFSIGDYTTYKGNGADAENKENIAQKMTTDQIVKAQDMSSRCMESDYTDC